MVANKEVIEKRLAELGCECLGPGSLEKCEELCNTYNVDEETFVTSWIDFSFCKYQDCDPIIQHLLEFERKKLKQISEKLHTKKQPKAIITIISEPPIIENDVEDNDVLKIYGIDAGPSTKQAKRSRSPEVEVQAQDGKLRAIESTFVAPTFTAQPNVPSRYPSSANAPRIISQLGKGISSWTKKNDYDIEVKKSNNPHIPEDAMYMFSTLSQQGAILTFICEKAGERLCNIWSKARSADVPYVKNVLTKRQAKFRTWGRISSGHSKKIDPSNVFLEGCRRAIMPLDGNIGSPVIRLDLSKVPMYSIFPGQIVGVECTNPVGNALQATDLFVKGYAEKSLPPKLKNDLNIVVAGGPFTASDNLNYDPLWAVMDTVSKEEPHLLILIGPLVDCNHSDISKAVIKDSFEQFFEKLVSNIMQYLKGKCTQVVLVASNKDAHHDPVYPTPQYAIPKGKLPEGSPKLHMMPDPCILDLDGFTVGITSVDIVKHLGSEEVSNAHGMDRMTRLVDHLLCQHCFYPYYPPSLDVNVDTSLWEKYAFFDHQPHLMILPSDLRFYCKIINDCLVVNPERLTKHTYARLNVRAASDALWKMSNNVTCEIVKT